MSLLGQQRRIAHVRVMSASPLIPVELMTVGDGRNGPIGDLAVDNQFVGSTVNRLGIAITAL
jgi:hypothetical protein